MILNQEKQLLNFKFNLKLSKQMQKQHNSHGKFEMFDRLKEISGFSH